jgi:hypothetical protein
VLHELRRPVRRDEVGNQDVRTRGEVHGDLESLAPLLGMHVLEVRQVAADDEQVEQALVDFCERRHERGRLRVTHRNTEPLGPLAGALGDLRHVEPVMTEGRRRDGNQRHRAQRATGGRRRPHVRMHRTPEGVRAIGVARDFEHRAVVDRKHRRLVRLLQRRGAAAPQSGNHGC